MIYQELKKQAIKDLTDYYFLKSSLDTLTKEISLLKNSGFYSSPSFSHSVMSSHSSDNVMLKHISRIEALEKQLARNKSRLENIDLALNALRTPQREILFSYYINRQRTAVTRLAIDSHTDRSALYRRANRALDKYILAYFGTLGDREL
ncbi:MAG: hypothetical protein IKA10_03665 [Oscillospiraceae bacterium]|nr:hypothetical protein [Oscillospiraceae bacterium]